MVFGITELDGRFMIDLTSRDNIVSPSWLDAQGIPREFQRKITVGRAKTLEWKGEWQTGAAVAFTEFLVSGRKLHISLPYVIETQVFYPPKSEVICCDGVLGLDFFQKYVVSFDPQDPANILLWDPVLFRPSPEMEAHALKVVGGRFVWKNPKKAQAAKLPSNWMNALGLQAEPGSGLGKFRNAVLTLDLPQLKVYVSPLRQVNGAITK